MVRPSRPHCAGGTPAPQRSRNESRPAEVPGILSETRRGNEPRAAEVPFFTLLDPLSITSATRHRANNVKRGYSRAERTERRVRSECPEQARVRGWARTDKQQEYNPDRTEVSLSPVFRFSALAEKMQPSPIRELFQMIQRPGMISFAGGLPDPDTFPVEAFASCCRRARA